MRTEGGLLNNFAGKAGTDNTFNGDGLVKGDFPAGMVDGQATADARSGGTAIHFPFGKDADVAAVKISVREHLYQNCAIEEI